MPLAESPDHWSAVVEVELSSYSLGPLMCNQGSKYPWLDFTKILGNTKIIGQTSRKKISMERKLIKIIELVGKTPKNDDTNNNTHIEVALIKNNNIYDKTCDVGQYYIILVNTKIMICLSSLDKEMIIYLWYLF